MTRKEVSPIEVFPGKISIQEGRILGKRGGRVMNREPAGL